MRCQVDSAVAHAGGPQGSFVDAALDLGYLDAAALDRIKAKLGEGANVDLRKKWPEYKNWDFKTAQPLLKMVPCSRNLLNHDVSQLTVAASVDTIRGTGTLLDLLGLDGSQLEVKPPPQFSHAMSSYCHCRH